MAPRLVAALMVLLTGCTSPPLTPVSSTAPPSPASAPRTTAVTTDCPADGTTVSTADELHRALATAVPGSVIRLTGGVRYHGRFVATVSGTAERPIWLCGPASAVLDGGGVPAGRLPDTPDTEGLGPGQRLPRQRRHRDRERRCRRSRVRFPALPGQCRQV